MLRKGYSWQFWITFWSISAILLMGWYLFLQVKNNAFRNLSHVVQIIPFSQEMKDEVGTVLKFADRYLQKDDRVHVFLLLLQNNWELRPGGGYIGSFGIVKIQNGSILTVEIHDTSNFDGRIPDIIEPPYPMKEMLRINSWKFRDSNFSIDFPTNSQQAEIFYRMGDGSEQFDGVIGVTANTLASLLEITGPIEINGQIYTTENAINTLEYQVEKGYAQDGFSVGERKAVMRDLASEISNKLHPLNIQMKFKLAKMGHDLLKSKDIQLSMREKEMQDLVLKREWGGAIDSKWTNDFIAISDANLGAYKSDPKVKRDVRYSVDFSRGNAQVDLSIRYNHTAQTKDWMTKDYAAFTRVYVPNGTWVGSIDGIDMKSVRYGSEFGKKYIGFIVKVPIGQERVFTLHYTLPKNIVSDTYDLKINKQAGAAAYPYQVTVKDATGHTKEYGFDLKQDTILSSYEKS